MRSLRWFVPILILIAPGLSADEPELEQLVSRVVSGVAPTVVRIEARGLPLKAEESDDPEDLYRRLLEDMFRLDRGRVKFTFGSGVIVHPDGLILTTAALVRMRDPVVDVWFTSGRHLEARVVGVDAEANLALLKVSATGLPVMSLARTEAPRVGQLAVAFGNPFGVARDNKPSVNFGIVSAVRSLEDGEPTVIQTDAAVNPGSYGGPLVDVDGRLLGIIAPLFESARTKSLVATAVPVDQIRKSLPDLKAEKKKREKPRAFLGVFLDPDGKSADGRGLRVEGIVPESPAGRVGIREGDRLVAIDGKKLNGPADLQSFLKEVPPGTTIVVTILRDDWERDVTLTLTQRGGE